MDELLRKMPTYQVCAHVNNYQYCLLIHILKLTGTFAFTT